MFNLPGSDAHFDSSCREILPSWAYVCSCKSCRAGHWHSSLRILTWCFSKSAPSSLPAHVANPLYIWGVHAPRIIFTSIEFIKIHPNSKRIKIQTFRSSQSRWFSCTIRTNLSSRTMFFLSKGEGLGSCFQKQSKRTPNLDKKRTKKNGVLVALPTVCWKSRNTSQKDVPGQGVRASVNQWRCYLSRHQRNQRNPGICLWALCR